VSELAKVSVIPQYLKAKSPEGLRRLMLIVNMKHSTQFVFHSIQFVQGYWYAWFYVEQRVIDAIESTETI